MKDTGQDPIGIFLHNQEMPFPYLIRGTTFLSITTIYFYKFIITPSIATSESTSEHLPLGDFTT